MSVTRRVNITPVERIVRVVIGVAGLTAPAVLLTAATSPTIRVLEGLLALAGVEMVVTGATGHCPLYQRLGHIPRSLRGRAS